MVLARVCFGGKGKLHFVEEKAKINATYYISNLLPKLIEDCDALLQGSFIFQQDGATLTVHALRKIGCGSTHLSSSIRTNGRLTLLILIHSTIMSGVQCSTSTRPSHRSPKPRVLERIWADLPQEPIEKA